MNKTRLEAFSDGVFAIIITIMVLEIKVPHGANWSDLEPLFPVFLSYVISFIYVGIYWGNHHHLLHTVKNVSSGIIWANLHLLFWLSLLPVTTGWLGENHQAPNTIVAYSLNLMLCGAAYTILIAVIRSCTPFSPAMEAAIRANNRKSIISTIGYLVGIGLAYVSPLCSEIIIFLVATTWLVPDKHIERALHQQQE
ncbi:Uncharacterized membrane protein [Chitinophaga costaii]|uniref:Uncharacterized membrane protein n=1 Tax=Chitinophaga costaii TaxID=1335309 RepID=A0A1C4EZW6_9BACT|nr:TMEM175 family protein [Chitinophaga costaii]PUZ21521.1 DUF1211 domain-containing protein [Chitinophaga costaii]SCC48983.1 Uncharacterized membrane protein [Chitinophaga costaii]